MLVTAVRAVRFRSLAGFALEPAVGVSAVIGPNGAGKTNLLESLYFGLTGRSFRTADRRDLIPFGGDHARSEVTVEDEGVEHRFLSAVSRAEGGRLTMDGAPADRATARKHSPMLAVFSPDRLELVKGPPSGRRAHLDAYVGARWPAREDLRRRYGQTLAQRNALLGRIARGEAGSAGLDTWNRTLADVSAQLIAARRDATAELAEPYASAASELGLPGEVGISYRACSEPDPAAIEAELGARTDADLRAGRTTWGPHLDELRLEFDGRQLRRFGSQGQQRVGLLALLFAEREALLASGSPTPMMLLDDVMSELDEERRGLLVERLSCGGQSVITAAEPELVPELAGLLRVPMEPAG